MSKAGGAYGWVKPKLEVARKRFKEKPKNPSIESSTYSYSTDESRGDELGSSGERGHPEIACDPTARQDTTPLDSQIHKRTGCTSNIEVPQSTNAAHSLLTRTQDAITMKITESNEDSTKQFLKRSSLENLLPIETVEGILNEEPWLGDEVDVPVLAKFIKERGLSVFAILIRMKQLPLIRGFHRDDFHENMLPINVNVGNNKWHVTSCFNKASNTVCDTVLQEIFTPENWTFSGVIDFFNIHQWFFFPLVFTQGRFRYNIPTNMRLPYAPTRKESKVKKSHYSNVEEKDILPEYFKHGIRPRLNPDGNVSVAIKTLIGSEKIKADGEARTLKIMLKFSSVHLIKAYAYICRGPEYSFVFPWAEHGNLWDFWMRETFTPGDHEYFIKVFQQLTGLTRALNVLANENLRHGDLKPENIVCFTTDNGLPVGGEDSRGVMTRFVITDVGLAKKHKEHTQLRTHTETKVSTIRYAAPELETNPKKRLSRRFDVWSMGCIFFEFAIWLIYGKDKLLDFTNDKSLSAAEKFKFFVTKQNRKHLHSNKEPTLIVDRHPTVDKLISEMQSNPLCSKGMAIRRLIDLISNKMLVVYLSDDKEPDPETEVHSTCECVKDPDVMLFRFEDSDSEAEQESAPKRSPTPKPPPQIQISETQTKTRATTNLHSTENNSHSKQGRCYSRVVVEDLETIFADLKNGSIDAMTLGDKAAMPIEAPGHVNNNNNRVC